MPAPQTTPVEAGEVLAGKYRVERVLGVGGMGVVVAAMHLQLEQRVALKFLLHDALQNAEVVARFAREARAASRLKSVHVARVIDVGELPNGSPYMVMEYLEGHDLAAELASRGPLPLADAVDFLVQASEAIAEAHALGIVHRDLKPANLFLTKGPDGATLVKLLDFGISKPAPGSRDSQPEMSLTKTSSMMGSPLYMSPEQLRSSRDVDARADVWALGVMLHELLAGEPPFLGESFPQLIGKIFTEEPRSLATIRPDLPAEIIELVRRTLSKSVETRTQSVLDFVTALAPFGAPSALMAVSRISRITGIEPPPASVVAPSQVAAATTNLHGTFTAGAWDKGSGTRLELPTKSRAPLFVAAAGVTLALGGVALFLFARSESTPPAPAGLAPAAASLAATVTPPAIETVAVPPPAAPPPLPIASQPTVAPPPNAAPIPVATSLGKRPAPPAHRTPVVTAAAPVSPPVALTPAPTSKAPTNPLKVDIK